MKIPMCSYVVISSPPGDLEPVSPKLSCGYQTVSVSHSHDIYAFIIPRERYPHPPIKKIQQGGKENNE